MYTALYLLLLFAGVFLVINGIRHNNRNRIIYGVLLAVMTIAFFAFLDFWGEMLWFESLGYDQRFWIAITAQAGLALLGLLFGLGFVFFLTLPLEKEKRSARFGARLGGAIIGALWAISQWETILKFAARVSTDLKDPILAMNTSFYLFTLPFLDALYYLLLLLTLLVLAVIFFSSLEYSQGNIDLERIIRSAQEGSKPSFRPLQYRPVYIIIAVLLFIIGCGKYLDRYHLMYAGTGVVTGAGWTDVHIRLPLYTFVSVVTVLLGLILLVPYLRSFLQNRLRKRYRNLININLVTLALTAAVLVGIWFICLTVIPQAFQWLRVEPNEITYEKPYIAHNIKFTRHGFDLHDVHERKFPVAGNFTEELVKENQNIFSNVRLWDWRALDAVFKQFQEIRLYYEFADVDIDRYTFSDNYRQVMVSAREMDLGNLPEQSQTFINRRFKYTHGYGITMTNVSEFTPEGLPHLLIKDIPPQSRFPELNVSRPEIYYGELTNTHVIVNSSEKEFDHPKGEENAYIRYAGQGGVQLKNYWWRKFIYGWKFDGTKLFLSSYPTSESRIMFHRQVRERVQKLAPFLHFDDDPYIVLDDGNLYWIIDAYTTSKNYPYSETFSTGQQSPGTRERNQLFLPRRTSYIAGANYIRNSVKAVVNAYSGEVNFYIFEEDDPLIRVWSNIYPGLFKPRESMPDNLINHVRYPTDMLLLQGLVYSKYHMTNPTVFYNQEDLWVRATEKYYGQVQPVQPYYVMWELPGSNEPEFVLILPFTPKNRQVLIGWIAGMCDPDNYGRLLAYKFPKEKRVLGPQQVETKIDQDSYLSGQLTLWDQRGSSVIRGNVLAIPIEDTLLYVEPIYLQAETAAYPELRLVVTMHQDNMSYAETFEEALRGLYQERAEKEPLEKPQPTAIDVSFEELITRANQAFKNYLRLQHEMNFTQASKELEKLHKTLQQLSEKFSADQQQEK